MNSDEPRAAFEELLRQHERQLFGYLFSLVRNLQDTEDLFQQTALALWEQFDRFERGTNFAAWACSVARFRAMKFIERERRPYISLSESAHAALLAVETASDPVELEQRREALAECVEKLADDQRDLLMAYYIGEQSAAELGEQHHRSTHSIHSSLRNTRRRLTTCVEGVMAREDHR